jgi:hypothetical protein
MQAMKNFQFLFALSEGRKIYQASAVDFGSRCDIGDPAKQRLV